MRFVLKPSYSSRIMKVSSKEIKRFDEFPKESFFASAVVYSEGSCGDIVPFGDIVPWPCVQLAEHQLTRTLGTLCHLCINYIPG